MSTNIDDYDTLRSLVGNALDCPGAGGNISVKDQPAGIMYIKSSGIDLKKNTFHPLDGVTVYDLDDDTWGGMKPSMEVSFHKKLKKYVLHYHPVYVNYWLCSKRFSLTPSKKFRSTTIEYFHPGTELADQLHFDTDVFFLKNHGVIIHSDNIQDIIDWYIDIKERFMRKLNDYPFLSPDDAVLQNEETFIHHWAILGLQLFNGMEPNYMTQDQIDKLNNDANEKHRKEMK